MKSRLLIAPTIVLTFAITATAAEHRVEVLKDAPPTDELSDEVAAQVGAIGWRVIRGTKTTVCEVWPCKEWNVKAGFQPTPEDLYPFQPGQLIGVVRFRRRGSDFRDQDISRGVYTLRYGLQPVDGNHEGTSPTRDFLLMVKAEDDESAEPMDMDTLNDLSAEAAESSHPAMLCLQKVEGEAGDTPTIRHDEDQDWWIVRFANKAAAGGQTTQLPVDVVVAGAADE